MTDKLGLKPGEVKELKIGKSFTQNTNEFYHTIRYDFKPASFDKKRCGTMDVSDKEVTVTVPLEGHGGTQEAVYKGSKTPASKDYLLVVDHDTGHVSLEKLTHNIRVKKTRSAKSLNNHRSSPYSLSGKQSPGQGPSLMGISPPNIRKPSPPQKSPPAPVTHKTSSSMASMPLLPFDEEKSTSKSKTQSIMSDSSSESSASGSGSSSSSESEDSDSDEDSKGRRNSQSSDHKNILDDDLNLSEED